jgi:cyclopropane fatty-acyl-phospholipid synthase-like methyltransferase
MRLFFNKRKPAYYHGLRVKADPRLHEQVADRLATLKPAPAKVLDFGAGEGALSCRLAEAGYDVLAADIDQDAFRCPAANFVRLNFDDKQAVNRFAGHHQAEFDAVLGIEVIEHVENPWDYVRCLASMLRPGGVIVVTTPNITSWLSRFRFLFAGRFQHFGDAQLAYGHIAPISAWELQLIFERTGLAEVSVASAGTLPPLFITGLNRELLANLFMLALRPFLSGLVDGWCIMATGRKA